MKILRTESLGSNFTSSYEKKGCRGKTTTSIKKFLFQEPS